MSQSSPDNNAELQRCILHGLACEWEWALWVLDETNQDAMRRPMFSLRDMTSKLGHWCGERREICLSRQLVFNHPWYAVVEVLRHEMAHQLTHEVLGAYGESPHGHTFRHACDLLRANPNASGEHEPLEERVFGKSFNPENKLMGRVRKLMALAKSRNQNEAEAAMAKAHQLIAKYNLKLATHDNNHEFVSIFVGGPALRHFREEYSLARLLTDFYFVYGVWVPAFVMGKRKMGRVLEISGTVLSVRIAHYVYDFVKQFINSKWEEYNKNKGLNRHRKTDFAVGVIDGFCHKVESRKEKKRGGDNHALVKIDDAMLKEYIGYKYPRLTSTGMRALRRDRKVLNDGISAGKRLVIPEGITEKRKGKTLLIENKKG
ncbi:MAG: DUF2786 domain-containing protein [Deltaproteobacteria bacterium]|nr:DUF2786 domain-containing protein [Deltaproteobacteria bacterium]